MSRSSHGPCDSLAMAMEVVLVDRARRAPVDYTQYEEKWNVAFGAGLGIGMEMSVGAVDEGLRYEDEKIEERVESDVNAD
ncbi:hypothetical protein Hdeb2414_s0723g00939681 [Helianthus debilis subsp. tardiflorus]